MASNYVEKVKTLGYIIGQKVKTLYMCYSNCLYAYDTIAHVYEQTSTGIFDAVFMLVKIWKGHEFHHCGTALNTL